MTDDLRGAPRGVALMALLCALALSACPEPMDTTDTDTDTDTDTEAPRWTEVQWAIVQSLAATDAPAIPASPSNAVADDAKAAALGQMFYFETSHSGPISAAAADTGSNGGLGAECELGKVSCDSCHMASTAMMIDTRSNPPDHQTTLGTGPVGRNAPAVVNSVYYDYIGLSGARDSLWAVSAFATNAAPLGSSELTVAHMIDGKYRDLYNEVFDDLPADVSSWPSWGSPGDGGAFDALDPADQVRVSTVFANYAKALGAYQRQLVSVNSDFDQYVAADGAQGLTEQQELGLELFIGKAKCVTCHSGTGFTDNDFHNIATSVGEGDTGRFSAIGALNGFRYTSAGQFSDDTSNNKIDGYPGDVSNGVITAKDEYLGQFRTQSLRGIADSGPYMHKGNLLTLAEVVEHYDDPPSPDVGVIDTVMATPLGLTADEQAALVAFLDTLSGASVPSALLMDTSRTNAEAQAKGLTGYEPSAGNLPAGHPCTPAD
jgi:cytochrome c peroxidase